MFLAFLLAAPVAQADMVSEFQNTCFLATSKRALAMALTDRGWKAFATLSESRLEREIAAVSPMLEAQGHASDFTIFHREVGGRRFELTLSETRKPVKEGRNLIGCGIYDFEAKAAVDAKVLDALVPNVVGQTRALGDVEIKTWQRPFGGDSEMRAVYVPSTSPVGPQLGFSGMMLGTSFIDGAR